MRNARKPVRYDLVVLPPGSDGTGEELLRLTSDRPFWPVRVGDEVLPRRWVAGKDATEFTLAGVLLRVTKVRHVVCESDCRDDHVLTVFTEDVSPNNPAAPA